MKADTIDNLTFIITKKIEKIGRVNAKVTMITTELQMPRVRSGAILLETATVQNV